MSLQSLLARPDGGLIILAVVLAALIIAAVLVAMTGRRRRPEIADLLAMQAEMQGRIAALTEQLSARQAEFGHAVAQRIDGLTRQIGASLGEQTRSSHEDLVRLQERLGIIDSAQNNIQKLAGDIVSLQSILSNKQARGAFGQGRMEAIIADHLPHGSYEFQANLPNGSRPDCLIMMPNGMPPLAIDAKFPLEAWRRHQQATTPEEREAAARSFRQDMEVHCKDIAGKYLLPGETQDTAFLFVPSESIFADLHQHFAGVVEKAHRLRITIVSPSILMLSIRVLQSMLRDHRMREEAHLIQKEVGLLMQDLGRLDERVQKLQGHFALAQKDVEQISISSSQISRRAGRIDQLELGEAAPAAPGRKEQPAQPGSVLKFRMVDEE